MEAMNMVQFKGEPHVLCTLHLVPHGYEAHIYVNGEEVAMEAHDFRESYTEESLVSLAVSLWSSFLTRELVDQHGIPDSAVRKPAS
jgi:hypothetical protein